MRQILLWFLATLVVLASGCSRQAVPVPAPAQPTRPAAPATQSSPAPKKADYTSLVKRVEQVGEYFNKQPEDYLPTWIGVDEEDHLVAYGEVLGPDGIYSNGRDWFKQSDLQMMIVQEIPFRLDAGPAPDIPKQLYVVSRPTYQSWPGSGQGGAIDLKAEEVRLFTAGQQTRMALVRSWVKQRTGDRFSSVQSENGSTIITLNPASLSETGRMAEAMEVAAYTLLVMGDGGAEIRYPGVGRVQSLKAPKYDMAEWFSAGAVDDRIPEFFQIDGGSRRRAGPEPFGGASRPASLASLLEQRAEWKRYLPAEARLTIGLNDQDHRLAAMLIEAPVAEGVSLEEAVADYQRIAERLLEQAPGVATVHLVLRKGNELEFQSVDWTDLQMAKLVDVELSPDRTKPLGPVPNRYRTVKP